MDKPNKDESKPSWDHINADLKGALDTWTDLTGKLADKVSPDEVQLREIKNILVTLKDQLEVFNDDRTTEAKAEPITEANAEPSAEANSEASVEPNMKTSTDEKAE